MNEFHAIGELWGTRVTTQSLIDLRSDTVTRPTAGMRAAIAVAEVGDDMYGEDPTVNRLERRVAELFGKEAAVYACSGTQSNQMGLRAHCLPGDEILIEDQAHIFNFEQGAPAVLSGITCRHVRGRRGMFDVEDMQDLIRKNDQHSTRTRLVCLENTTNMGGGHVWPAEQWTRVADWAHRNGLIVHVDGARFFNAVVAAKTSPARLAEVADTVSICFSKGLGAPMGSMLIGSKEVIAKARRARKLFGGALRQSGMMAAAAEYALDHHVERLADDHAHAKLLAELLAPLPGVSVDPTAIETNIVFIHLDPAIIVPAELSSRLKQAGVLMNPAGKHRVRACTHLDVDEAAIRKAAQVFEECLCGRQNAPVPLTMGAY